MNNRQVAFDIFNAGVEIVKPDILINSSVILSSEKLTIHNRIFDLTNIKNIYVIGAGKASALMAKALENVLGTKITCGHIVTKYGHSLPLQYIGVTEAGHPVPDNNGLEGTTKILSIVKEAKLNDLVICLLSGGGSALLTDVPGGCTLADIASMNNLLLRSGANISEINCIRKHLSNVKGGHLAKLASPAVVISLILSDVIGDPIDVIASGPTAPDESTFADALEVIERYNLSEQVSPSIYNIINSGVQGKLPETLKKNDIAVNKIYNFVIGNNTLALQAAKAKAEALGYITHIETNTLSGDVEKIATIVVETGQTLRDKKKGSKCCVLYGGEPTVKITGNGLGGRNQHLALIVAQLLQNQPSITVLCGGTDGTDGPTEAAGAVVDCNTAINAASNKLNIDNYLQNCNSNTFFQKEGGVIITGPTQTNVMDIIVLLVD